MADMTTYRAILTRDPGEGVWLVGVPDIQGCHTWAKTLKSARANTVEVIKLCLGSDEAFTIDEEIDLPAGHEALDSINAARSDLDRARSSLSEAQRSAAMTLVNEEGLSLRDAGDMMDLSFQRVQQLVSDPEARQTTLTPPLT